MGGDGAVPERLSMFTRRRLIAAASAVGALSVAGASVGVPAAGASNSSVAASPVTGVISVSAAKALGYPKAIVKPVGSSKTGQKDCPKGAQATYSDSAGKTGVGVEILVCNSAKVAASLLATQKKATAAVTLQKPPTQLGPSAFETTSNQSEYLVFWQRGKVLSVVALNINIPASSSSSSTTTAAPLPPPSAKQQQALTNAALVQDKALK
ncbi:MAG: hypothetical protein WB765_22580 [Acidimicrobiales bacterium]|jgi:hypothetical protein